MLHTHIERYPAIEALLRLDLSKIPLNKKADISQFMDNGSKVRRADIGVDACRSEPDQKRQMTAMSPLYRMQKAARMSVMMFDRRTLLENCQAYPRSMARELSGPDGGTISNKARLSVFAKIALAMVKATCASPKKCARAAIARAFSIGKSTVDWAAAVGPIGATTTAAILVVRHALSWR